MNENSTKIIVVVGMHRSGTSVITRGLQVLGVELGDRLMAPAERNNPKGFWEDMDINALNIEMLNSLNSDWHFLTPIQPTDVEVLCTNGYLQRAAELLREKIAGRSVFGFKNPRVAKLLPFWKKVFAYDHMNVDYVLVIRHPLSVCDSLAKRDGFDAEKSYLLWLEHVIGSLVGTEGENRVLVDYDIFMQAPERELSRIAKKLKLSLDAVELQYFRQEFLDHQLQHTVYQFDDLMRDNRAFPLVQEIYSALLDSVTSNVALESSLPKDKIKEWEKEFSRTRSALVFVDKLGLRIAAISSERNSLLQERAQMKQSLARKEQAIQKLNTELSAVYHSRLWRWAKPFRKLFHLFQQDK